MDDRTSAGRALGGAIQVVCLLLFIGAMVVMTGVVNVGHDPAPELPSRMTTSTF